MPRTRFPGVAGLVGTSRWRRLAAALGAIGLTAVAIAVIVVTELPGSSHAASQAGGTSGGTTVQRRNLVATDTESGTLSYANPQTVFNRVSGTITSLPAVGQLVKPGQTLYQVSGAPVVLFNGTVPAYRDLTSTDSNGPDVLELNQNLRNLGFDPSHQIALNDAWQAATTSAVDSWQGSLGQTETGTITLGQVVFLPGTQRITAIDTVLGSTGGASGSGASGSSASTAFTTSSASRPEFVSLTTTASPSVAAAPSGRAAAAIACSQTGDGSTQTGTTTTTTTTTTSTTASPTCNPTTKTPTTTKKSGSKSPSQAAILLALLRAETLELKKSLSGSGGSSSRSAAGGSASAAGGSSSAGRASGGGGAATSAVASSGGASTGSTGASSGSAAAASAQAILQTTSNQLVVTVDLDATKQSEAVVSEPVSVQLPNGDTVGGKITQVSPIAQSTSSSSGSSSSSGGASSGSSSAPSATVPVTIQITGHHGSAGLDQAAVSVDFQQQVENNVLSVPVTALLATPGGGYAVQEVNPPHALIAVTPGLFAAGYVQISGAQIYPGLQVTDSQG